MSKVKITYADGYSEVVAVDAPNQRDAELLARRYSERPEIQGGRGIAVVSARFVGTFEPKEDDHLSDLGGRW